MLDKSQNLEKENQQLKNKIKLMEDLLSQFNSIKKSYDNLIKNLKEKDKQLEELNEKLEIKVKQRTKELELKNLELLEISTTDSLTKVKNRRAFDEIFLNECNRAKRENYEFNILILDIDYFKNFNDKFGHKAGDDILFQIGNILNSFAKRSSDFVFRYGGEEFIYISCFVSYQNFVKVAEKIRKVVEKESDVTISIGGVASRCQNKSKEELFVIADKNLYKAKKEGRNRAIISSSL